MILAVLLAAAAAAGPTWDSVFATRGARAGVTVVAVFEDREGRAHRVSLWREGDRLRRETKETRIFGERRHGDETYLVEKVGANLAYRVRREELARLRIFTGWESLASLLERPAGTTSVRRLARSPMTTRFGACDWWEAGADAPRVCWSGALRLPLAVEERRSGAWKPTLTIEELRRGPVDPRELAPPSTLNVVDVGERLNGRDD